QTAVTVTNVAPVILIEGERDGFTNVGSVFTHTFDVIDDGPDTITVDFGDGTTQTFVNQPPGRFTVSHVYNDDNSFDATITADDARGGIHVEGFRVDVHLARVNDKLRRELTRYGAMLS